MPVLPPDKNTIAFQSAPIEHHDLIYTMRPDGTNVTAATPDPGERPYVPTWSPDGRYLVYPIFYDPDGSNIDPGLILRDVQTGETRRLNHTRASIDLQNIWSPDGEWIVFSDYDIDAKWRVYRIRPDGTDQELYFEHPTYRYIDPWSFSPDGLEILYSSLSSKYDLFKVGNEGNGILDLTHHLPWHSNVGSWSPNGQEITYHAETVRPPTHGIRLTAS